MMVSLWDSTLLEQELSTGSITTGVFVTGIAEHPRFP